MAPSSRARFQADLESAALREIPHIRDILKKDDGFVFTFHHPNLPPPYHVTIGVVPQDETYLVYTDADVPSSIAKELEDSMHKAYGLKIPAMLDDLSTRLRAALGDGSAQEDNNEGSDVAMTDIDDMGFESDEDTSDGQADFEYNDDDDLFGVQESDVPVAQSGAPVSPSTLRKIRQDFCAAREAGFKIGILCGFRETVQHSIVSVSVRVDKLCLSDETLQAWDLDPSEFVVLLIRFTGHYTTFEDVMAQPSTDSNLEFCLRRCSTYKPTLQQAIAAFSAPNLPKPKAAAPSDTPNSTDPELSMLSIGTSIDIFMQKDFIPMLKLKNKHKLSWDDSKKYLATLQKTTVPLHDLPKPQSSTPNDKPSSLPGFLVKEDDGEPTVSLPLVAMRFALRYLVRCVDYCMICHQKVDGNFEALKPYVCGDSLCLFQYMSLGFGPSIEYEILRQPLVVDLLVSFCYASLVKRPMGDWHSYRIREFPTGLSLSVPNIRIGPMPGQKGYTPPMAGQIMGQINAPSLVDHMKVKFKPGESSVFLTPETDTKGLRQGQWIAILTTRRVSDLPVDQQPLNRIGHIPTWYYARIDMIIDKILSLHVVSRHTVVGGIVTDETPKEDPDPTYEAEMVPFDQNLDELDPPEKALIMQNLISALPSVTEMREFLVTNPGRQLASWSRMVPSSMVLLRWIVASNRSYIRQMDGCTETGSDGKAISREHEKIKGVDGWIQFRFAQGSPEKEAFFQQEVARVIKRRKTLIAWHGSNLGNWHSIIRQGLNYQVVDNGRASGDGIYCSREFDTSLSYCGIDLNLNYWAKSTLKMNAAIGLVELVNQPEQFMCTHPHFVVQHCHWIQCRYLFIRTANPETLAANPAALVTVPHAPAVATGSGAQLPIATPQEEFKQDPGWIARGPRGDSLFIPKIAISSASRNKARVSNIAKHDSQGHSGDTGDEDEGDIEFLFSENFQSLPKHRASAEPKTQFRPGALDLRSLPLLQPPSYATGLARKAIQKELKKLQQIQSSTPLEDLGWYMDFDAINNMFQWIVELHSFDLTLPLGQDMKKLGVDSIVLEIRFGRDFPMSPPFVRVIRPRFLSFLEGGGGHVTAGGAMCMELLTTTGWSPANSLESVFVQVRVALCSTDPQPARLQQNSRGKIDYGASEAFDAYDRAAKTHGWKVPADQVEMQAETLVMDEKKRS